ncbi:MAG: ERF family protein [Chloroflexota bacterium]
MNEERAKLFSKWVRVMDAVTTLPKLGINKHFGYAFTRDEDVMAAVHRALVDEGLVLIPSIRDVHHEEMEDRSGNPQFHVTVPMIMIIGDAETGEEMEVPWFGEAFDSQDKGTAKATTLGEKYFLLKALLISTEGDDPDSESGGGVGIVSTDKPGDMVIPFAPKDKQALRNKTIAELYRLDKGWIEYLAQSARQEEVKAAAAAYIAEQNKPKPYMPPTATPESPTVEEAQALKGTEGTLGELFEKEPLKVRELIGRLHAKAEDPFGTAALVLWRAMNWATPEKAAQIGVVAKDHNIDLLPALSQYEVERGSKVGVSILADTSMTEEEVVSFITETGG